MRRAALALTVALAAVAAAVAYGTAPVPAHHDQGPAYTDPGASAHAERGPLCNMKPNMRDATKPGEFTKQGADGCVAAVARNLVGDVGGSVSAPIRVCAGPDYDDSTREAIRLLNSGTAGGFGRALFAWGDGLSNCGHELTSGRVSSIVVTDNHAGGGLNTTACRSTSWACTAPYTVRDAPHYGYVGQAEVRINPALDVSIRPYGAPEGACLPAGQTYDPRLADVAICTDATAGNLQTGRADGTLAMAHLVAHELMHVAGLRDYYCGTYDKNDDPPVKDDALVSSQALMDSHVRPLCYPSMLKGDNRTAGTGELATAWDRTDYTALYSPAAVTGLQASETGSRLRLSWTAGHVHVERGFAVERWTGSAWERVPGALAPANAESTTIARPSSRTTYRVASLTAALGPDWTPKSSASVTYTPGATSRTVTRSATATSTVNQTDANTKAETAARAALVAAYPGVTVTGVTHAELAESTDTTTGEATGSGTGATKGAAESAARSSATAAARAAGGARATVSPATITGTTPPETVTRTGTGTGSGTGATKGAAESAARSSATAAARAAGGARATVSPATITSTTPPETGTATGSGSSEASQSAANADAIAAARRSVPGGATITGTPTARPTARGSRTETTTGIARGSGFGATASAASSWASSVARGRVPPGATVTAENVHATPSEHRTGTTTVSASYTADTEGLARYGCASALAAAARAVSGYVSHSSSCSVTADIGAKGETIYTASGTATVTWRLIVGWSANAIVDWSRTVTIVIYNATGSASWSRGSWSADAEADWSRTDTVGEWGATATADWSRTVTTYNARGTATGTVPR